MRPLKILSSLSLNKNYLYEKIIKTECKNLNNRETDFHSISYAIYILYSMQYAKRNLVKI